MTTENNSLDVLFIVDASGSMGDPCDTEDDTSRIEAFKQLARFVIYDLLESDAVGFVAFSDDVVLAQYFVEVTEFGKKTINESLSDLRFHTSTCFAPAFQMAKVMIEKCDDQKRRCVVVFVIDGVSSQPVIDARAIQQFTAWLRERCISCIAIGIGANYNVEMLNDMIVCVGGKSLALHVQNPQDIQGYLQSEIAYARV